MAEYRHHVSGFFVSREAPQMAFSKPNERGIFPDLLSIDDNKSANSSASCKTPS